MSRNKDIQQFFSVLIRLPKWMVNLPFNSPVIMAYCVNQFIGREMLYAEINSFHDKNYGTTPNGLIAYFKSIGLEVESPDSLNHQTIKEGLNNGVFTFLAYHNDPANISFIRFYDSYLDKFLLFDFKFELLELNDLNIIHFFTVNTKAIPKNS